MQKVTSTNDLTFDLNLLKYKRKYQWWLAGAIALLGHGLFITFMLFADSYSSPSWEYMIVTLPFLIISALMMLGSFIMHTDYVKFKKLRESLYSTEDEIPQNFQGE